MQPVWTARKRSETDMKASYRSFVDNSYHYYQHPLDVLSAHPEVPSAIVDYRDLVTDPAGTMLRVYAEIEIGMAAQQEQALANESGREYRSGHTYSLAGVRSRSS